MKKLKKIAPFLLILAGLACALYPWISEYLFENRADSLIGTYQSEAQELDDVDTEKMLAAARAYNKNLLRSTAVLSDPFTVTENAEDKEDYNSILALDSTGLMGTIEIPCIKVDLPIYHGTSDEVLQKGIGHLEGSSFPVGGEDTHAVLSGHTGLNTAKLFTDLTEVEEGDLFYIHILGDVLAYKVRDINVVEPSDTSLLQIKSGEDLVTLVTCTPYGVNSHRLLVTGERTEYVEEEHAEAVEKSSTTDSNWMEQYKKALIIGLCVAGGLILTYEIVKRIRRKVEK